MATIGELRTLITAQSEQFEASMKRVVRDLERTDRARRRADRGFESMSRSMKSAAKSAAGLALAYVSVRKAISGIGDSIVLAGRKQASEAIFGKFFGGPSIGSDINRQLTGFAATTPFELTELREAAVILAPFVKNHRDLLPLMRNLGELAAGTGSRISDLAMTWSRNSQMVKQNTRDIREWQNRGINVAGVIADEMNISVSEFFERVEDGAISFDMVNDAITRLATGSGKFADSMKTISGTIQGQLSNAQDSVDNLSTSFGEWAVEVGRVEAALKGLRAVSKSTAAGFDAATAGRKADREKQALRAKFEREFPGLHALQKANRAGPGFSSRPETTPHLAAEINYRWKEFLGREKREKEALERQEEARKHVRAIQGKVGDLGTTFTSIIGTGTSGFMRGMDAIAEGRVAARRGVFKAFMAEATRERGKKEEDTRRASAGGFAGAFARGSSEAVALESRHRRDTEKMETEKLKHLVSMDASLKVLVGKADVPVISSLMPGF